VAGVTQSSCCAARGTTLPGARTIALTGASTEQGDIMNVKTKLSRAAGIAVAAMGMATLGLAGAATVTRYLRGMLFGLSPLDPATLIAVSLMFGLVATAASYIPARRATNVDPLVALRCE